MVLSSACTAIGKGSFRMTRDQLEELAKRATDYLSSGGLFNPELADHQAVSVLIRECRDAIRSLLAQEPVAEIVIQNRKPRWSWLIPDGLAPTSMSDGRHFLYAAPVPAVEQKPITESSTSMGPFWIVDATSTTVPAIDFDQWKAEAMRLADSFASDQAFYGRQDWHTTDSRAALAAHLDKIGGK
jgi:hypothetical protein